MQQVLRGFQRRVSRMWARVLEAVQVHEARVSSRHAPPSPPDSPPKQAAQQHGDFSRAAGAPRAQSPRAPASCASGVAYLKLAGEFTWTLRPEGGLPPGFSPSAMPSRSPSLSPAPAMCGRPAETPEVPATRRYGAAFADCGDNNDCVACDVK